MGIMVKFISCLADEASKGTRSTIKLAQDLSSPVHIVRYKEVHD